MEDICFIEIFIGIKMKSNQANEMDGSYHIRVNPLPVKKKPKPVPVETKEVKNDKANNLKYVSKNRNPSNVLWNYCISDNFTC